MDAPASRLPIDRATQLPSINTFGELSQFLREAIADEDSRLLSQGMGELAQRAEQVIEALRRDRRRDAAGPQLMDMLTVLRDHRNQVVDLGPGWRGLYEYAAYLQALNNFRVLIGQWLTQVEPWSDEVGVTAQDFALVTWRTLGEGMLLIDMYERCLELDESDLAESGLALHEPQVDRVMQWWHRLRR